MDCQSCAGTMNEDGQLGTVMMHTYPKRILQHLSVYDPNTRMVIRRIRNDWREDTKYSRYDYAWPGYPESWLRAEWFERLVEAGAI